MNLNELFKIQAKLDERIVQEHGLQGQDLLDKKILALQVELGELANEWRWFKFWSTDKESRTEVSTGICLHCSGTGNEFHDDETMEWEDCPYCEDGEVVKNPLLEEFVDCLHFILSIGDDIKCDAENVIKQVNSTTDWILENRNVKETSIVQQFNIVFNDVATFEEMRSSDDYYNTLSEFFILGTKLEFTDKQVEQAYMDKNKINHERQNTGY